MSERHDIRQFEQMSNEPDIDIDDGVAREVTHEAEHATGANMGHHHHHSHNNNRESNRDSRTDRHYPTGLGIERHEDDGRQDGEGHRTRKRTSTIRRESADIAPPISRSKSVPWSHHRQSEGFGGESDLDQREPPVGDDDDERQSAPRSPTCSVTKTKGSDGSTSSCSTVTQTSFIKRESGSSPRWSVVRDVRGSGSSRPARQLAESEPPNALSFLDPDSPAVTEESIRRSVKHASTWRLSAAPDGKISPSARSTGSSSSRSSRNSQGSSSPDAVADHETDRSSSPEQSVKGSPVNLSAGTNAGPAAGPNVEPKTQRALPAEHRYGTPEMPRGNANLPHIPAKSLNQARAPGQSHPKPLPRAEKLPLSGYELLAAKLSGQDPQGGGSSQHHGRRRSSVGSSASTCMGRSDQHQHQHPPLKPIYRRFEALNHRLLLHLQDELSELEEQLHRLDTADTQTRRVQSHILPASRRAEYLAGGELQWHRTDILGKVGFKLSQYNHVLTSFTETQRLPAPSPRDVEDYRTYLATQNPIAEIETRFLDPADDLISLAPRAPTAPRSSSPALSAASSSGSIGAADAADDAARRRRDGGSYYHSYHSGGGVVSDDALTPMPRQGPFLPLGPDSPPSMRSSPSSPVGSGASRPRTASVSSTMMMNMNAAAAAPLREGGDDGASSGDNTGATTGGGSKLPALVASTTVAFLVPMLAFAVIPGFLGRMAVVLLIGLVAVIGALPQSGGPAALYGGGKEPGISSRGVLLCAGVYGGVMAVIAGVLG